MAAITGVFSALIFYGFLTFYYQKHFNFNIQYEGDWSTDSFDMFLTRIMSTDRSEFCLEILSKFTQKALFTKWRSSEGSRRSHISSTHVWCNRKYFLVLTLLLSGDIPTNPGPIKKPCIDCSRPVRNNQQALMCDFCDRWVHRKCTEPLINIQEYHRLGQSSDNFYCQLCINRLPDITDSFFSGSSIGDETFNSSSSSNCSCSYTNVNDSVVVGSLEEDQNMSRDVNIDAHDQNERSHDVFQELRHTRLKFKNNTIITYLNVNSIRYKFLEVGELLYDKLSDICFFAETKLDDTFNQRSFNVVDYKAFRNDRNASGGGLMAYVRSNLPARRRPDLELQRPIETIVLDVLINDRKWAVIGAYRPPSVDNKLFTDIFTKGIDKISTQYDNIMVAGDLNYDCLDSSKSKTLSDICDIFDFTNLVKTATCFMKHSTPSLVDVLLTNKSNFCFNVLNFGCGISDWHNLIGVVVKGATARLEKKRTKYRSYKNFNETEFSEDVGRIPFHAHMSSMTLTTYTGRMNGFLTDIINEHAPIKEASY